MRCQKSRYSSLSTTISHCPEGLSSGHYLIKKTWCVCVINKCVIKVTYVHYGLNESSYVHHFLFHNIEYVNWMPSKIWHSLALISGRGSAVSGFRLCQQCTDEASPCALQCWSVMYMPIQNILYLVRSSETRADWQGGESPSPGYPAPLDLCAQQLSIVSSLWKPTIPRDTWYNDVYLETCLFVYLHISHVSILLSPMLHVFIIRIHTTVLNWLRTSSHVTSHVSQSLSQCSTLKYVKDLLTIHGIEVKCSQHILFPFLLRSQVSIFA